MDRSTESLAFERYLRTGRKSLPQMFGRGLSPIETKFNPNHDPLNGQFIFGSGAPKSPRKAQAGWGNDNTTGSFFGGGGATGTWTPPARSKSPTQNKPSDRRALTTIQALQVSTALDAEDHVIVRNGYTYHLDTADRTMSVTGTLTPTPVPVRSRSAQIGAGGRDRLSTDDGDHYIAPRFNGPTEAFNHFAQNANVNRGGYRVLEDEWAKDVKQGKRVYVSITSSYAGASQRPSAIRVIYTVNGNLNIRSFPNSPKGKSSGK